MYFLKDPMVRRFISAAFFASAFVWVAVSFFDVEIEVVRVLFIYSIGFVILMILLGLLAFPVLLLFRHKRSSLLGGGAEASEPTQSKKSDADESQSP